MEIKILASSSKGNAYIIEEADHSILIDPGLPIRELKKRSNFKLSGLELCLISHEHRDHCRAFSEIQAMGIPCAMSCGTYNALGESSDYTITKIISNPVHNLESEKEFNFKGWSILPFSVQHDAVEPLGFLIRTPSGQKICYATDTYYLEYKFRGVTHWLVEANYKTILLVENEKLPTQTKNRIIMSHFEIENVKKFFKAQDLTKTKRIYLIHLSEDNADPIEFTKEIEAITGIPVYTA